MSAGITASSAQRSPVALAAFVLLPWCMGLAALGFRPPEPVSEAVLKWGLAVQHGRFDTVVVGDSRVLRVGGPDLTARGWNYFNMGLSGMSPEDIALQLRKALVTQQISRVIMGLSFENMTEETPFEFSVYANDPPFRDSAAVEFVGKPGLPVRTSTGKRLEDTLYRLLPVGVAGGTARYWRARMAGRVAPPVFRDDGRAAYVDIERDLGAGSKANFSDPTDPEPFFSRTDSESAYLAHKRLSADSERLFSRIIDYLSSRRISVVMFETGRSERYQKMIDDDPLLHTLQSRWRDFFRAHAGVCVRFLEDSGLHPLYDQNDFFDAVHYIGSTEGRISRRLADELADVETQCRKSSQQNERPKP